MSGDGDADATLELTILSDIGIREKSGYNPAGIFSRTKTLAAVAWIDPAVKRSIKTLASPSPPVLHLPLTTQTLANLSTALTLQILSSGGVLRFRSGGRGGKVEGTAIVPLSSLTAAVSIVTLPIRRPSGLHSGWVRVSARVLWCLGPTPATAPSVEEDWADGVPVVATGVPIADRFSTEPKAPLIADWDEGQELGLVRDCLACPSAPPMLEGDGDRLVDGTVQEVGDGNGELGEEMKVKDDEIVKRNDRGAMRNFVVGMMSGVLAVVLVGVAGLSGD